MHFLEKMYVGKGIGNIQRIQKKLMKGVGLKDIYVISLSHGSHQLECIHCLYLQQERIREHTGLVVGMAKGYPEAKELMVDMIKEAFQETGNANVKEYLLNNKTINNI